MNNNKRILMLYSIALKWRWILYLTASFIIFVSILIVLVTDKPFNSFLSKVLVNTAIIFVIAGKILAAFKKAIENKAIPWASIGGISGLLIVLVWSILRLSW